MIIILGTNLVTRYYSYSRCHYYHFKSYHGYDDENDGDDDDDDVDVNVVDDCDDEPSSYYSDVPHLMDLPICFLRYENMLWKASGDQRVVREG